MKKEKKKNRRVNFPRYFIRRTMSKPAVDPGGGGDEREQPGGEELFKTIVDHCFRFGKLPLSLSFSSLFRLVADDAIHYRPQQWDRVLSTL